MRKLVSVPSRFFLFFILFIGIDVLEARIFEVPSFLKTNCEAPKDCLDCLREFLQYVGKPQPELVNDFVAQEKFISSSFRVAINKRVINLQKALLEEKGSETRLPTSNDVFVGFWDLPTTYAILGSRNYNERAMIDVLYTWGKSSNYPGEKVIATFVFSKEQTQWKIEDIYICRGGFNDTYSLVQLLREKE